MGAMKVNTDVLVDPGDQVLDVAVETFWAEHTLMGTWCVHAADCVPLGSTLVGGSCAQFVSAFKDRADTLVGASDQVLRAAVKSAAAPDASCCSDATSFVNGVRPSYSILTDLSCSEV